MLRHPLKNRRQKNSLLNKVRWAGYAAAGAATVLGTYESAEAEIHYGTVDVYLNNSAESIDVNDDGYMDLKLEHRLVGTAGLAKAYGLVNDVGSASIVGFLKTPYAYASNLGKSDLVDNTRDFVTVGTMAFGKGASFTQFLDAVEGYIGFSFNAGGGPQYGWLQVSMKESPLNAFTISNFAYADVGDPIHVPEPGSLGLLATGAIGLLLWRRCRRRNDKTAV